jgi:hypothetical protein
MGLFGGDYWLRFLTKFCPTQKVILTSGFLRPETEVPYPVVFKPYDYKDLEARVSEILQA